jgi:hypothetical protein
MPSFVAIVSGNPPLRLSDQAALAMAYLWADAGSAGLAPPLSCVTLVVLGSDIRAEPGCHYVPHSSM